MEDIFGRRISRLHRVPPRPVQAPGLRRLNGYTRTRIRTHAHTHIHTHTHTHTHTGACAPCPAGSFMNFPGATTCVSCANGSIPVGGGGASSCAMCAAGTFTANSMASVCSACSPGKFVDVAASSREVLVEYTFDVLPARLEVVAVLMQVFTTLLLLRYY